MSKMHKTIGVVPKEPREFDFQGKVLHAVDITFDDGEQGSIIAGSVEQAKAHIAALEALKGKEEEFDLEDKGTYQGTQKWKILSYPGKPAGSGGGGGGGPRREWIDTTPSIEAQNALNNAVQAVGLFSFGAYPDGTPEYIGLVREIALGLAKVTQDVKAKVTGTPMATAENAPKPEQPTLTESDGTTLAAMREAVVAIFGTKGAASIAYKNMTGTKKSFDSLDTDDLDALIEFKNAQEIEG